MSSYESLYEKTLIWYEICMYEQTLICIWKFNRWDEVGWSGMGWDDVSEGKSEGVDRLVWQNLNLHKTKNWYDMKFTFGLNELDGISMRWRFYIWTNELVWAKFQIAWKLDGIAHDVDGRGKKREWRKTRKTLTWCGPFFYLSVDPGFHMDAITTMGGVCMSTKIFISYKIWY